MKNGRALKYVLLGVTVSMLLMFWNVHAVKRKTAARWEMHHNFTDATAENPEQSGNTGTADKLPPAGNIGIFEHLRIDISDTGLVTAEGVLGQDQLVGLLEKEGCKIPDFILKKLSEKCTVTAELKKECCDAGKKIKVYRCSVDDIELPGVLCRVVENCLNSWMDKYDA